MKLKNYKTCELKEALFNKEMEKEKATNSIQELEQKLSKLACLPQSFDYITLYQNIKCFYEAENYKLISDVCDAILKNM